jgi:hypothetical protein
VNQGFGSVIACCSLHAALCASKVKEACMHTHRTHCLHEQCSRVSLAPLLQWAVQNQHSTLLAAALLQHAPPAGTFQRTTALNWQQNTTKGTTEQLNCMAVLCAGSHSLCCSHNISTVPRTVQPGTPPVLGVVSNHLTKTSPPAEPCAPPSAMIQLPNWRAVS